MQTRKSQKEVIFLSQQKVVTICTASLFFASMAFKYKEAVFLEYLFCLSLKAFKEQV